MRSPFMPGAMQGPGVMRVIPGALEIAGLRVASESEHDNNHDKQIDNCSDFCHNW